MISYITLIDILISKMPFCDFFDWHWKKIICLVRNQ